MCPVLNTGNTSWDMYKGEQNKEKKGEESDGQMAKQNPVELISHPLCLCRLPSVNFSLTFYLCSVLPFG
jgi:hypothetical protein